MTKSMQTLRFYIHLWTGLFLQPLAPGPGGILGARFNFALPGSLVCISSIRDVTSPPAEKPVGPIPRDRLRMGRRSDFCKASKMAAADETTYQHMCNHRHRRQTESLTSPSSRLVRWQQQTSRDSLVNASRKIENESRGSQTNSDSIWYE